MTDDEDDFVALLVRGSAVSIDRQSLIGNQ